MAALEIGIRDSNLSGPLTKDRLHKLGFKAPSGRVESVKPALITMFPKPFK